jgi:hypothetical protein
MTTGQNPLAGVPLRCLIGGDGAGEGKDGELIMAPYDATVAPRRGYSAKYLNLYREDGEPPAYGPYLPRTTTARDYHEGVPDPGGAGFWRNLDEQLLLAKRGGFAFVETDNCDAYANGVVLRTFDRAAGQGLQGALQKSRHERARRGLDAAVGAPECVRRHHRRGRRDTRADPSYAVTRRQARASDLLRKLR